MKTYSLLKSYVPDPFKSWCSAMKPHLQILCPFPKRHELNKPVFVIGSSRSGTTKLARTLALLPAFKPLVEHPFIRHTAWRIAQTEAFDDINWKILHKQLIRLSGVTRRNRIIEKTPANSLLAHFIGLHAKEAIFIHSTRDGRDVALSMLGHDWIRQQLTKDQPEEFWWKYVDASFRDRWNDLSLVERGLLRWGTFFTRGREAQQFEGRYFELAYESLCHTPEQLIEFVREHLGVSKLTSAFVNAARAYKPKSVGRYKTDAHFTKTDQKTFQHIASSIGYRWEK